ncbi:MAG: YbaK/EbsC family protein [Anaerosomatales bacterium]|nr:YbaK/EbsC family protein [Anaerosomatales bacterium]MDT8433651.1 YbaK/EbsC family protein [Anaerosomatales bacterium]
MSDRPKDDAPKRTRSADRVRAYLAEHGLADEIVTFEQSTKTAQMAADAMGCELGQIVKSLVFVAGGTPVLALVAGDRRGDTQAIAELAGAAEARFADADTVRAATGYAIGGVSPFDLPRGLMLLADDSLGRYEIVYPAAGTPSSMVRIRLAHLLELTGARVARISQ